MNKKILGLDLGTNSIGWAVIGYKNRESKGFSEPLIIDIGSRIIPMTADVIGAFGRGALKSETANRRTYRMARRMRDRHLLRRQRLHRVLNILEFLPEHYTKDIDFRERPGQIMPEREPKLAYKFNESTKGVEFYFRDSFEEMLGDFAKHQPELVAQGRRVPYDWTIYYLRKKALTKRITKEELAWLILNFNQKRGYQQQRGVDDDPNKAVEYHQLKVKEVVDTGEKNKKGEIIYNIVFENGWEDERASRIPLVWAGMTKDFIVTTTETKSGETKRSFREPKEDDWTLVKKRTEQEIEISRKKIGEYIYDKLLANPDQKIIGGLIQAVERKLYREELNAILKEQMKHHPELKDKKLYEKCIKELYRSNIPYRNSIQDKDFRYLIADDILFYHRPLKSKKSSIENCQYEYREFKNLENGEKEKKSLKAIPRSHPLFEEFRLWQFLKNVRILNIEGGQDATAQFLPDQESYAKLFKILIERKDVKESTFFSSIKGVKFKTSEYKWNYGDEKKAMPVAPVGAELKEGWIKSGQDSNQWNAEVRERLWHILYSVSEPEELKKALNKFAIKHELQAKEEFVERFIKIKPFESSYASYSAKAIKRLLSLMRMGEFWSEDAIDSKTKNRIEMLINGEDHPEISEIVYKKVHEVMGENSTLSQFSGLPLWLACYVIYNRHSEGSKVAKWDSPEDIGHFLREFGQYSLRNPIVEQIVSETMRLVEDIWRRHGKPDEIHVELGREMKSSAEQRKKIEGRNNENEISNIRIRAILTELKKEGGYSVRPESYSHHELMKLYEEGALGGGYEIPDYISEIIKSKQQPSSSDIIRYKCWLEQKYRSPYTGENIKLSELFTVKYDIEHIIPKARYYDDSFSNKIICERAVNQLKGAMLAAEFIESRGGETITINGNDHLDITKIKILTLEAYEALVNRDFKNSWGKKKKLLMTEIPDEFISRQLNDTRYISRYIMGVLSNIVRETDEREANSKNVIPVTGGVTARLKADWGLNDVWNRIVTPRFERLNEITNSSDFGYWTEENRFRTMVPEEFQKGYSKKRIDHRHHAMDALVVACASRNHVNYLNNQSANPISRKDDKEKIKEINKKLRYDLKRTLYNDKGNLIKPWDTFTQDAHKALNNIVVSFKQNLRVINKSTNRFQQFRNGKKEMVPQTQGENWAIRKPLHLETVFGKVNIQSIENVSLSVALNSWQMIVDREIRAEVKRLVEVEGLDKKRIIAYFKELDNSFENKNVSRLDIYYFSNDRDPIAATRKPLNDKFTLKNIESVTDSGIRKILYRHLETYNGKPAEAFGPEGIEAMNRNITSLNNGKSHKPIYKVRVSEALGLKFQVGQSGNKKSKYVVAATGTNLYYAVYQSANGKRSFATIPFENVIENLKQGEQAAPAINEKGDRLLFTLSPDDLIYLPTPDQLERQIDIEDVEQNKERIYKVVSFTGVKLYTTPYSIANIIADKKEFGSENKMYFDSEQKIILIPIKIDRLGKIIDVKSSV